MSQILCVQAIRVDAVAIKTMLQSQKQSSVLFSHVDMMTWQNKVRAERNQDLPKYSDFTVKDCPYENKC